MHQNTSQVTRSKLILNVVRNNSAMQAQLADLYVEALGDERIHHDVLNEVSVKLQAAVTLARENQDIWEKTKKRVQGSRQAGWR